jgi:hypothetical protein
MYAIDFMTRDELLTRSIVCHPSALIERLERAAKIHTSAAAAMSYDRTAANIANGCAEQCFDAIERIKEHQDGSPVATILSNLPFGAMIQMFTAAAELQCVPFRVGQEIIERTSK